MLVLSNFYSVLKRNNWFVAPTNQTEYSRIAPQMRTILTKLVLNCSTCSAVRFCYNWPLFLLFCIF